MANPRYCGPMVPWSAVAENKVYIAKSFNELCMKYCREKDIFFPQLSTCSIGFGGKGNIPIPGYNASRNFLTPR